MGAMFLLARLFVAVMLTQFVDCKIHKLQKSKHFTLINGTGLDFEISKRRLPFLGPSMYGIGRPFMRHYGRLVEECSVERPCPQGQFCDVHTCRECLKEGERCHFIGTCCDGECQYGRCTKGVKPGDTGTYCDRMSDCTDKTSCCIREITVSPRVSVCKPMLEEHESCGPINLFHQIYSGGKVEPACGPCKPGLQCKNVGIRGLHFICLKEKEE